MPSLKRIVAIIVGVLADIAAAAAIYAYAPYLTFVPIKAGSDQTTHNPA